MQALRDHFHPDEITAARIVSLDDKLLDTLIHGVGFHAKKTVYMKKIAQMLLPGNPLDEKIPTDLDTIVKQFPGIGPKMGILYLQNAQPYPGQLENDMSLQHDFGLAVDTHVLRLSQQFGLVFPPSSRSGSKEVTPEIARVQIEDIVPKEHWKDANPLLVGFGQTICGARSKMCGHCIIADTGLCKSVDRRMLTAPATSKKRKSEPETSSKYFASVTKEDSGMENNGDPAEVKLEPSSRDEALVKIEPESKAEQPVVDIEELVSDRRLRKRRVKS